MLLQGNRVAHLEVYQQNAGSMGATGPQALCTKAAAGNDYPAMPAGLGPSPEACHSGAATA